jgi:hypothetical protein
MDHARALGERAGVMASYPRSGLINVRFDETEDGHCCGDASDFTAVDFALLSAFLDGLSSIVGRAAMMRVLHPVVLVLIARGAELQLRRRARHDKAAAKQHAEAVAQIEELVVQAADVAGADETI